MLETTREHTHFRYEELPSEDRELIDEAIADMPEEKKTEAAAQVGSLALGGDAAAPEDTPAGPALAEAENKQTREEETSRPPAAPNRRIKEASDNRDSRDSLKWYLDQLSKHELLTKQQEQELSEKVQQGLKAGGQLNSGAANDDAEEIERLRQIKRDGLAAKDTFIKANLGLAASIAMRYPLPNGIDRLDLIEEANLGLEHAVDKFDSNKGFKFSTYAAWWIHRAIGLALDEKVNIIRLPSARARELRVAMRLVNGDADGLSDARIARLHRLTTPLVLSMPIAKDDGDEQVLGDILPADQPGTEEEALRSMDTSLLRGLLEEVLTDDEYEMLKVRYYMDEEHAKPGDRRRKERTMAEVGERFGMKRNHAGELIRATLGKLREDPSFARLFVSR